MMSLLERIEQQKKLVAQMQNIYNRNHTGYSFLQDAKARLRSLEMML